MREDREMVRVRSQHDIHEVMLLSCPQEGLTTEE